MENTKYTFRYLARVQVEAETPLSIGAGNKDETRDRLTEKDMYGLPYIPGTSISGVLRHSVERLYPYIDANDIFGYQKGDGGQGSRLLFTDGCLVGPGSQVVEGLCKPLEVLGSDYHDTLKSLPLRQHVRIAHNGATDKKGMGKFDEEVVFKGVRFVFELELLGDAGDQDNWDLLMSILGSPLFRLGGGTRKGFGRLKIVRLQQRVIDCGQSSDDLQSYLDRPFGLNNTQDDFWKENSKDIQGDRSAVTSYQLELQPDDFFLFRHAEARDRFDASQIVEDVITWGDGSLPVIQKTQLLIPASSVKGALAHRVAYHYNKEQKVYADELDTESFDKYTGEKNPAVRVLFGNADKKEATRGALLFSDFFMPYDEQKDAKVFNHVKIDRLTGGAIQGALFDERAAHTDGHVCTDVDLDQNQLRTNLELFNKIHSEKPLEEEVVIQAWELALEDLCMGALPLGGAVNHGHGRFNGKWNKL